MKTFLSPSSLKSSSQGNNVKKQKYIERTWEATEILNHNVWRQESRRRNGSSLTREGDLFLCVGDRALHNHQELEIQVPWKAGVRQEWKTAFQEPCRSSQRSLAFSAFRPAVKSPCLVTPHSMSWKGEDSSCLRRGGMLEAGRSESWVLRPCFPAL